MAAQPPKQPLPLTERARLRQLLDKQIAVLTPERLRAVVLTAFRNSSIVVEVFQSLLLVPEDDVVVERGGSEDENEEDVDEDDDEESDEEGEAKGEAGDSEEEEARLPYTEHRKYPSQEIIENLESKGRVALERYMAQFKHRRTGNMLVDEFNGTASIPDKQNPSHKRNLSAYSDMPVQPALKKPSATGKLVARYAMCQNCEHDFDVTQNFPEACNYHEGQLEVDYDSSTWEDWDENCHGRIEEMEKEYPEGFLWSCCEGDGTAPSCQTSQHQQRLY